MSNESNLPSLMDSDSQASLMNQVNMKQTGESLMISQGLEKSLIQKSKSESSTEDDFRFFTEVEIEKSKNAEGKEELRIKGVASTRDVDSDQEILEPTGYILSKFLDSGFLNYNHRSSTDPTSIVGEPTNAYIQNGELIVEGILYPDSKKARELYDTIQVLNKNSKSRRMGMSIEGKALQRDPLNKKRITKAMITGCAITPTPKNAHTLVEVMKGEVDDINAELEFEVVKSDNGGELEYLVDVVDDNGYRRTVDKFFNIKVEKMDLAAYGLSDTSYGTTQESLAGTKKKKKVHDVSDMDFFEKTEKKLSKSETYHEIFTIFTNDTIKAKDIYSLLEDIESLTNKTMEGISQETINKAKELFSLAAKDDSKKAEEQLKKSEEEGSEESDDDDDDEDEEMKALKAEMQKAKDAFDKACKAVEMKVSARVGKEENLMDSPDEDGGAITTLKSDEPEIKKGEDFGALSKGEVDDLVKAQVDALTERISEKLQAAGELYLDQKEDQERVEKALGELEQLVKGMAEKVDAIASQPVTGQRGIITKGFVEKFHQEHGEDAQVLSLRDRRKAVNMFEELSGLNSIEKGGDQAPDEFWIRAMQEVEASGGLSNPEQVKMRLKKEHNIHLVG